MPRLPASATSTAALAIALSALSGPALSADRLFQPELRPAYNDKWAYAEQNPLTFETGVRYWHAWGQQDFTAGGLSQSAQDVANAGEAHFRINDSSTDSYVRAYGGYAFRMEGTYSTSVVPETQIFNGRLGYVGADFGYMPFGNEQVGLGALVGYLYWHDSPNTGRDNFTTATSSSDIAWTSGSPEYSLPFGSEPNNLDIHALRLGLTGRAELNEFIDVTGEIAAVPYAHVSGTLGQLSVNGPSGPFTGDQTFQGSPVSISGLGYGAMGELMVGFKPTENIALRLGGRAWYVQGQAEATYRQVQVTGPADLDLDGSFEVAPGLVQQSYISTQDNPFSVLRYGLLAELTATF